MLSPRLDVDEPLRLEMQDFVECIATGRTPVSNAALGHDVVRMIEATERSLSYNGSPFPFETPHLDRRRSGDRRRSEGGMPVVPGAPLSTTEG